jgi:hypothetical protein
VAKFALERPDHASMSTEHSISVANAKSSIERTGFYLVKDASDGPTDSEETNETRRNTGKGKLFAQFYNAGYYTRTPQGLEFCFQNTYGDTVRLKISRDHSPLTL